MTANAVEAAQPGTTFTTYNFEVDPFPTYFAGFAAEWVHQSSTAICQKLYTVFLKKQSLPEGSLLPILPNSCSKGHPLAMTIYQIKNDFQYWSLLPTTGTAFFADREMFTARPMREKWTDPSFYVRDPLRRERGDFMSLGCPGTFAFSETVCDGVLGDILEEGGEVLPAKLDGYDEPIFVFNTLACYNCLDHTNCQPVLEPCKAAVEVRKFAFHPSRIGDSNIFKVPERFWNEIFVLSGREDPEDEFYAEYHRLNLKGLVFKEVWSDGSGSAL